MTPRGFIYLLAVMLTFVSVWYFLAPRVKFDFFQGRKGTNTLLQSLLAIVVGWLGDESRKEADALGWPVWRVPLIAGACTLVLVLIVLAVSPVLIVFAVPVGAYIGWRLSTKMLHSSYTKWQTQMVNGLPTLLSVMRVHLDLGRTVPDALKEVLPGAPPVLRAELMRILAEMRTAPEAKDGLRKVAQRVDRREWSAFADTMIQSWDSKLSGSVLEPLQDLLQIVRDKEAAEGTERLDMILTAAPGLAIFAIVVWGAGGMLISNILGGGGFSL